VTPFLTIQRLLSTLSTSRTTSLLAALQVSTPADCVGVARTCQDPPVLCCFTDSFETPAISDAKGHKQLRRNEPAHLLSESLDVCLIQPGLDCGPGIGALLYELQQLPSAVNSLWPSCCLSCSEAHRVPCLLQRGQLLPARHMHLKARRCLSP